MTARSGAWWSERVSAPLLAYVEDCLPAATFAGRIELARDLGLALEVADRPETDLAPIQAAGLAVVTLQAFGMHELHPLHPDPERRRAANVYVRAVLARAARARIPRVLTVCGFGRCVTDRAAERCIEFFSALADAARGSGVRILIEPLSPLRADAMTDPDDVARLLAELAQPDVFAAVLDTGHLLDGGHDPEAVLRTWSAPLAELQLRGADSRPPPPDVPLRRWLAAGRCPEVVSVEHRVAIAPVELSLLIAHLRDELR